MRYDLIRELLSPRPPTVRDMEIALRKVLRHMPEHEIEAKVGALYGSAFKLAECDYDAGKRAVLR